MPVSLMAGEYIGYPVAMPVPAHRDDPPRAYRYDFVVSRSSMGVTSRQKVPLIAPLRPGDTITVSERVPVTNARSRRCAWCARCGVPARSRSA